MRPGSVCTSASRRWNWGSLCLTNAAQASGRPVVEATGSLILWDAFAAVYDVLGFSTIRDEAFRALVLGQIIEPTSKVDTAGC